MDGEGEAPEELIAWLRISAWGEPWSGGWMKWPARWFAGVRLARNVYEPWSGYSRAEDKVKWKRAHRGAAGEKTVNLVRKMRREMRPGEAVWWPVGEEPSP